MTDGQGMLAGRRCINGKLRADTEVGSTEAVPCPTGVNPKDW
jgi:hypothetical protein